MAQEQPENIIVDMIHPAAPGEQRRFAEPRAFFRSPRLRHSFKVKAVSHLKNPVIIVDENLSRRVAHVIPSSCGACVSVFNQAVGLRGKKDPDVWQQAVKQRYSAILTFDKRRLDPTRDLTAIAIQHGKKIFRAGGLSVLRREELPVIIHLDIKDRHGDNILRETRQIFEKHGDAIRRQLEKRDSPYITVSVHGVYSSPTYEDMVRQEDETLRFLRCLPKEAELLALKRAHLKQQWRQSSLGGRRPEDVPASELARMDRQVERALQAWDTQWLTDAGFRQSRIQLRDRRSHHEGPAAAPLLIAA